MGYRSNVSIVFYIVNKVEMPTAALKLWFDENYPAKEAKEEWDATIIYGDDYVLVEYQDVKWYPGYTHPGEVNQAIRNFEAAFSTAEQDTHAAYEMVRTGEETEDIEEDRSDHSDYRLGVSRQIVFG
jgi:hypothetical protein